MTSGPDGVPPAAERRRVERFCMDLKAVVTASGGNAVADPIALTTRDVSMSGVFFLTANPLPIGTRVDVDMFLSVGDGAATGAHQAWIKASGAVQRVDSCGMAVRFDSDSKILPFSAQMLRPDD